ncbi:MAG: DUF2889 domain-containing protein [Gammaproteobacteria bacterium]|nr:DUF2889 domain-containing protein [Gammaproteobacteria bacterium]MBU0891911.1 DUF2889 domain-containing protein [Gammaproteobacteria bacterium]MBU1816671.1 DUF2889 domain-containing protein [Gammaproteobacteria bacterium]
MPLSPPAPRTLKHVRRVNYQGFERDDGLWDIEGELHDSKAYDATSFRDANKQRLAGEAIHHMWLRVTVNRQLVVQAIDVAMDSHPLKGCTEAQAALQQMVGCSMARGWRQAIQKHLGGVASCTHLRELLFNLATAAFQSVPAVFSSSNPEEPPRHLGQCTGWDFNGNGVKEYFPQFYGRVPHVPTSAPAPAPALATVASGASSQLPNPEISVKQASSA